MQMPEKIAQVADVSRAWMKVVHNHSDEALEKLRRCRTLTRNGSSQAFGGQGCPVISHVFGTLAMSAREFISEGRVPKVPLGKMPVIETPPFKRVALDLIGELFSASSRGHRYILTVVDYATRYPEAVALKNISTVSVAEALVCIFSRVEIPEEILSDQGTQFTSALMKEVGRLLSVKQLTTTPYHPQCNGLVERFNGRLKTMLKRMCAERPKDWDRYLDALLFAYREAPQKSLGFTLFELLYGRSVNGPLQILRQLWKRNKVIKGSTFYK